MRTLKLDYDLYGNPRLKSEGELLELARIDAKRIQFLLGPRAGRAIIKRSINGFHLSFPFSELTEEEVAWLMEGSPVDSGYRYWARERGSSTLRIAPKTILKEVGTGPRARIVGRKRVEDTPFVVEVLENPWSELPTSEEASFLIHRPDSIPTHPRRSLSLGRRGYGGHGLQRRTFGLFHPYKEEVEEADI